MNTAVATAATILGAFVISVAATWMVRQWLEARKVLDAPNHRSLHDSATVTGGGIAVTLVVSLVWVALWLAGISPDPGLLFLVLAVSLVGLFDDIHNIPWLQKLGLQVAIAAVFVAVTGPFTRLELFGPAVEGYWLLVPASVLWIVAFSNMYNFMDGIDGIAGGYGALCGCVLGIWFVLNGDMGLALFCYGLMAACLGFLVWNWAPARIFLGDTGSMTIGAVLAAIAIIAQQTHDMPLSAFILLYSVFIGDTVCTLVRRARRGEKLWLAHREHFYQRAVQSGLSHSSVTGCVLLISVIISVPASLEMGRIYPRLLWLLLCLTVLCVAMILIKRRERQIP